MASTTTVFPLLHTPITINGPIEINGSEGSSVTIDKLLVEPFKPLGPNVYRGKYKVRADSAEQDVAIKAFDASVSRYNQTAIKNEAVNLRKFTGSPYIITFFAYHCDSSGSLLVTELMDRSLADRLEKVGPLIGLNLLESTLQITSAVQVLYKAGFIHRDIKPDNILVNEEKKDGRIQIAKLADFGLAEPSIYAQNRCGTIDYMAPENYSTKGMRIRIGYPSDVFSTGMTMFTMSHGFAILENEHDEVYVQFFDDAKIFDELSDDKREIFLNELPLRKNITNLVGMQEGFRICSAEYFQLMLDCMRFNPEERPTAAIIVERLNGLIAQVRLLNASDASPGPESKEMDVSEAAPLSPLPDPLVIPPLPALLSSGATGTGLLSNASFFNASASLSSSSAWREPPAFSLSAPALPQSDLLSTFTSSSSSSSSSGEALSSASALPPHPRLFSAFASSSSSSSREAPAFSLSGRALPHSSLFSAFTSSSSSREAPALSRPPVGLFGVPVLSNSDSASSTSSQVTTTTPGLSSSASVQS